MDVLDRDVSSAPEVEPIPSWRPDPVERFARPSPPVIAPQQEVPRRSPVRLVALGAVLGLLSTTLLIAAGWWLGTSFGSGPVAEPTSDAAPDAAPVTVVVADEQNTIDVLDRFAPSTASLQILVQGDAMGPNGQPAGGQVGAGSGFLIESNGEQYLVSNFHVVSAALEPGTAQLRDDAVVAARFPNVGDPVALDVIGVNPSFDLALLQPVGSGSFPDVEPIPFADSDLVVTGQKTIAIGNPFGFDSTATTGIVSATGRFLESVGMVSIPMIQTDAAINPGNSGGALLNSSGELIGVNTAIINPESGAFAGIGLAVPSNLLLEALANLELGGVSDISDTRPSLGAQLASLAFFPPGLRDEAGLPANGVMVVDTVVGGPADAAGLRGAGSTVSMGGLEVPVDGDVILEINGQPIGSADELNMAITYTQDSGDVLDALILSGGVERLVQITLG